MSRSNRLESKACEIDFSQKMTIRRKLQAYGSKSASLTCFDKNQVVCIRAELNVDLIFQVLVYTLPLAVKVWLLY